ncbi:MAG TPA: DsbA family oxidoreductase [Egibacteraceae bacterium]|nr:DsbA family oxidoreductase [Egibacteraceae bacterium]
MQIEIWSDVVCPWCFVGKRRFEAALARFPHAHAVEVTWRSFELDPSAPRERGVAVEHLAAKYGVSRPEAQAMHDRMTRVAAAEGLAFRLDIARPGNTFDAHRLLHLAGEQGVQDAVKERLLAAYLCEGQPVGNVAVLARLAADAGLDPEEARAVLAGDAYAGEVRADEATARALGITSVPFFVVDRAYGVAGAQSPEVLTELLEAVWAESLPDTTGQEDAARVTGDGAGPDNGDDPAADGGHDVAACADGSCAVPTR